MKSARLLALLASLWSGALGLDGTEQSWTTPGDESPRSNLTSTPASLRGAQGLHTPSVTQKTSAGAATASEERPPEDSVPKSTLLPSGISPFLGPVGSPRLTLLGAADRGSQAEPPALPSKAALKPSPAARAGVLSNATLRFLQGFARKSAQQASSAMSAGDLGKGSPQGTSLSRGSGTGILRPSYQKPSFETTRGKNWCAYVHTRLSPTVILDSQRTYEPNGRGPCGWTSGSCSQRSQKSSHPIYRMQHKIVTSLDWRCCPGYSGPSCQPQAQDQQHLMPSSQAESQATVAGGVAQNTEQQQREDCADSAVMQKMTGEVSQQAVKLTLLQRKVDSISLAVEDLRNTSASLEGKVGDDKGREFSSFLKGLKPKSINDVVKDMVREQFKLFQNDMQETIAQLFKTVSSLSEDLENTRQMIQQVNQSVVVSITAQQKYALMPENRLTLTDIVDLKNRITSVRQEMTLVCEKPMKELQARQAHLEVILGRPPIEGTLHSESLHETLSKTTEVHGQLLSTRQESDHEESTAAESVASNATRHLLILQEKVNKQDVMILQMFNDLHIQNSKISNLTFLLEMEKESVRGECEEMLSKCRNDFKFQLKDTEENIQVLNQTLAEVVFPMDHKMDKMSERLNDLTYDMESLQPLLEQRLSIKQTVTQEQPREAVVTRKEVGNLIGAINRLNFLFKELAKRHNLLRDEVQSRGEALDKRISNCALEMEDGLNKTMTIMNNAIDFVQDNYVLKETLKILQYNPELADKCNQQMEAILAFIPQFQRLNDSIQTLASDDQKYNFILQVAKALEVTPKGKNLSMFSFQKIYQMFNETSSQVKEYQQSLSRLEENILSATEISKNFEARLQGVESKVTTTLIPYYISLKKGAGLMTEKGSALQLQVLNSRFKALEAKSIHLSINFSLLNKTVHELLAMCHDASALNATELVCTRGSLPHGQSAQEVLKELVESVTEVKSQAALANVTWNIHRLLSDSLANAVKSQKQVKLQKKQNTIKKAPVYLTALQIGRAQRNTDNIMYPAAQEHSACSGSPCQNGGTCIGGGASFTCACRHPFSGDNCTVKFLDNSAPAPDFSKGSYRYAPMVAFFTSHTYGMTAPGPILFNNLEVNYGASYNPRTGRFRVPYLGVYVFKYTIESFGAHISGFLVVDGRDKLTFESENINSEVRCDRVLTGDALLELNYGQEVWLRLVKGTIPVKYPPVTTFSGYLLYRT